MTTAQDHFKYALHKLFNGWSGLQLAVEHGMGGQQGQKVAIEIMNYVYEYCIQNENITNAELENLLEELLDQELNTICEDNSITELCHKGEFSTLHTHLTKFPQKIDWLNLSSNIVSTAEISSSSSAEEDCENDGRQSRECMEIDDLHFQQAQQNATNSSLNDNDKVEVDPEWTVVKRKNKKS